MERRICERIIVSLNVELISGGTSYAGVVENISEYGLYMITNPSKTQTDFASGTKLEVTFQLSSGETLKLPCIVKWSYKTPPHGLTNSMGLEILERPIEYTKFLNALK